MIHPSDKSLHHCVDASLHHFRITGKRLSDESGITQSHISDFRNGKKQLTNANLDALLDAGDRIQPGFRRYFALSLAGGSVADIDSMDSAALAQMLVKVADRLRQADSVLLSA
jgi:transcriptional regulator with XRE-family HTH domain